MRQLEIKAVRGATQVSDDNPELIDLAVIELFTNILERNSIEPYDIVSIIFSQTKDLRSRNPATALRGLPNTDHLQLFCVQELDIEGGLPRVIRILIHHRGDLGQKVQPVYLRGARVLRQDLVEDHL